jgi:hypothetical protein
MGTVGSRKRIVETLTSQQSQAVQQLFIKSDERGQGLLDKHDLGIFIEELLNDEVLCSQLELDPLDATTYVSTLLVSKGMREIGWDTFKKWVIEDMEKQQSPEWLANVAPELQDAEVRRAFNTCCNGLFVILLPLTVPGKDYLTEREVADFLKQLSESAALGEARSFYGDSEKAEIVLGGYFSGGRRTNLSSFFF